MQNLKEMMKFARSLIFMILGFLVGCSKGKTDDQTIDTIVCNHLAADITDRMGKSGLDLPLVWDDFESVRDLNSRKHGFHPGECHVIDLLALVPGAPLIEREYGLRDHYTGYQLVAISRQSNSDYSVGDSKGGRYVILASREKKEAWSTWITDEEADKVLKELKGFNPLVQPLAFPNLEQDQRDAEVREKKTIDSHLSRAKTAEEPEAAKNGQHPATASTADRVWSPWSMGVIGVLVLALIICLVVARSKWGGSTTR